MKLVFQLMCKGIFIWLSLREEWQWFNQIRKVIKYMNCMINENLYTKLRKSVWSSLRPLHKQNSYLHDGQSCHIVLLNITTALRQLPNITTTLQCL